MGYDIYDMNGYVGRLGSAFGLNILNKHLKKKGGKELKKFEKAGCVDITPELMNEIAIFPLPEDPNFKSVWDNFVFLVEQSQGLIMVSDGTNIDMRYLFDEKGCVGELCWGTEEVILTEYLEKNGGDILKDLAKEKTVKKTPKLMKELNALQVPEDPDIRDLMEKFITLAKKSQKVITITDGFDDDDDNEGSRVPKLLFIP